MKVHEIRDEHDEHVVDVWDAGEGMFGIRLHPEPGKDHSVERVFSPEVFSDLLDAMTEIWSER